MSCPIIPQVHFESNGKLGKAAALPGEKPAPNVGGLKLKPGLGMRQIDGAASDSPTTPTSPLILAKNPFAEVGQQQQGRDIDTTGQGHLVVSQQHAAPLLRWGRLLHTNRSWRFHRLVSACHLTSDMVTKRLWAMHRLPSDNLSGPE